MGACCPGRLLAESFRAQPLIVSIARIAYDVKLAAPPAWLTNISQLVLGCSLDGRIGRRIRVEVLQLRAPAVTASSTMYRLVFARFDAKRGQQPG